MFHAPSSQTLYFYEATPDVCLDTGGDRTAPLETATVKAKKPTLKYFYERETMRTRRCSVCGGRIPNCCWSAYESAQDERTSVKWEQQEPGWWTARVSPERQIGVCKETDGKWHSYVGDTDKPSGPPSFRTLKTARAYAEKRCRQLRKRKYDHTPGT
jgi:hypothetical protein